MSATIGLSGVYSRLRKACDEAGGQSAYARKHGLTPQVISDTLSARRDPSEAILRALKLKPAKMFIEDVPATAGGS